MYDEQKRCEEELIVSHDYCTLKWCCMLFFVNDNVSDSVVIKQFNIFFSSVWYYEDDGEINKKTEPPKVPVFSPSSHVLYMPCNIPHFLFFIWIYEVLKINISILAVNRVLLTELTFKCKTFVYIDRFYSGAISSLPFSTTSRLSIHNLSRVFN